MATTSPFKQEDDSGDATDRCLQGIKRWPEITELLSQDKVSGQQLCEAFEVLSHILQHVQDNLPEHTSTALDIIQKLLRVYIGHIYHALNASNHSNVIMGALNLLVAMVTFGHQAARDVMLAVNFQHGPFKMLINRINLKTEDDIRCCCIRLAMAFLVTGDNRIIKQMLANKEFIKSFFPKLKHDRASSIKLILVTLTQYVVCNPAVSKTEKLHILNDYTLQQIASLYTWRNQAKVEDPTDRSLQEAEIHQLCHQFLLKVACDLKHGINFLDQSLGLSGKNCNPVLLKFMLGLYNVTGDALVRELIVAILRTCPDLFNRYLMSAKLSFQPRQSPVWLANVKLLEEIMTGMPVVPSALEHSRNVSTTHLVQRAIAVLVPSSILTPTTLSDALKHPSAVVACRILDIIKLILTRAKGLIQWLGEFEHSAAIAQYQQAVIKSLPGVDFIVNFLHKTLGKSQDGSDTRQSMKTQETDGPEPEKKQVTASIDELPQPTQEDILVTLLDVLRAYQQTIPLSFAHSNYDFSHLPYLIQHGNTQLPVVNKKAIALLLAFPEGKLRGFKEVRGQEGSTVLLLLKQLTAATASADLQALRVSLLNKFIKETGLFAETDWEIGLWLVRLTGYDQDEASEIVKLFYKALTQAIRNPYPFTDRVIEAMNKADASREGDHTDNNAAVHDVLNVVQSMGAIDLDASYTQDFMIAESLTCSALLPSTLQIFTQLHGPIQSLFGHYISSVVLSVLDRQQDPLSICILLHDYTLSEGSTIHQLPSWRVVMQYFLMWLPSAFTCCALYQDIGANESADEEISSKLHNEWSYVLHSSILHGVVLTEPKVKLLLNQDEQELLPMIRQLLMYISTLHTAQPKKASVILPSYLKTLESIVNHVHCEPQESNKQENQTIEDSVNVKTSSLLGDLKHEWWNTVAELILKHAAFKIWLDPHKPHKGKTNLSVVVITCFLNCLNLIKNHLSWDELNLHLQPILSVAFQPFLETLQDKKRISKTRKLTDEFRMKVELAQELSEYVADVQLCAAVHSELQILSKLKGPADCDFGQHLRQILCCLLEKLSQRQTGDRLKLEATTAAAAAQTGKAVLGICDVSVLVELACRLNCDQLIRPLTQFMKRDPKLTSVITRDVLVNWLQNPSQAKSEFLGLLMESSKIHLEWFEDWCKHCSRKQLTDSQDVLLPVVLAYSSHCLQHTGNQTISIVHGSYWRWLQECLVHLTDGSSHDEDSHLKMNLLSQLLMYSTCQDVVGLLQSFAKQKQQGGHPVYNSLQLKTSQLAIERLCSQPDFNMSNRDNHHVLEEVIVSCLQSLVNTVKMQRENSTLLSCHLQTMSSIVKAVEDSEFSVSATVAQTWRSVVRNGLKHHFQSSDMLQLLAQLVKLIYCKQSSELYVDLSLPASKLLLLSIMYQIVLSHSLFLPTLLEEQDTDPVVKESLVLLMLTMVQLDHRCCHKAHYPVLVGAYNATMSTTDSALLMLMHYYQRNQAVSTDYRPVAWGHTAVSQHQTKKALGKSLWQQPTMKEILEQFETDVMKDSALEFPLHRKLEVQAPYDPSAKDCLAGLYDPCFLLPLFSYLLAPESLVDCSQFIESNALFFTLAGLASFDVDMRRASYHVLALFHDHMEGARFRGRREVYYILECLRNSVTEINMQLASVLVVFVAQAGSLMLTPAHSMYPTMLQYLLIKPQLQINAVPMFSRLFYSSSFKHEAECQWMMSLLVDGLRHSSDVRLYHNNSIFNTIQTCYQSTLATKQFKESVDRLLKRAFSVDESLIRGFLPHLQSPVHSR